MKYIFLCCVLLYSCSSRQSRVPAGNRAALSGTASEVQMLVEQALPSSLIQALGIIQSRNLGDNEFGRTMNAVIRILVRNIYPDMPVQLPPFDPSPSHLYTKILRAVENKSYTPSSSSAPDYLEYVLPFVTLLSEDNPGNIDHAAPDMIRAQSLNRDSVLAPYFLGVIHERAGRYEDAHPYYDTIYSTAPEMYPAGIGLSRILAATGRITTAIQFLQAMDAQAPDNPAIQGQLARTYYMAERWTDASALLAPIVQQQNVNPVFILMYAQCLVEQRQFVRAQSPLDRYIALNPDDRRALLLYVRIQSEGYHNREAALNYARTLTRRPFIDDEASVYALQLLQDSSRTDDKEEAQQLLAVLLNNQNPPLAVLVLGAEDAIQRKDWPAATAYNNRILAQSRSAHDLLRAWTAARGQGNQQQAFGYALELYQKYPALEDGISAYCTELIDSGKNKEASELIASRLAVVKSSTIKSQYYYLSSRIKTDEESILHDLRTSIFEDPRNLNSLLALFEFYHRKNDTTRAIFYFRQALSIDPKNPRLQQYRQQYG
ncbi:hypothetical protein FACS1894172_10260 [Spirochaetia bacterium]|nr:hypothetical protein FACS1894164_13020 [Spirochaetia bacterium]GHU32860.1 hypothetical protein FACS1894172_10260 [Spirochaetia bacterium]